jgi:NADH-quinone oxidoreductase subunit N
MLTNPIFGFQDFGAILPEILAFAGGILVLALDIAFRRQASKRILEAVSAAGLLSGGAWLLLHLGDPASSAFGRLAARDGIADWSRLGLVGVGLATLVLVRQQGQRLGLLHGEFYALLLFSLGAMMLFTTSSNLMLSFIALETFSLGMYVLAGFNKAWAGNREAAIKYFLLGAFAAAFFLLGLTLVFGTTASVNLADIAATFKLPGLAPERLLLLEGGVLMVLVAFAFKVGLAPFHLWVPDVYEGAPTPVTAFLSAGAKFAAFGALLRLLAQVPAQDALFVDVIGVLAVLTLLAGNLGALKQLGLKRLLAYSSIAHSGYALIGLLGLGVAGGSAANAVLVYVLVYGVMNFLCFALVSALELQLASPDGRRTALLSDLQGLGFERPWFGLAWAVAMVSMAGLPPTAGFFAKFGVFKAALEGGHSGLAAFAILNSVLSAAVYLRVLVALYMLPKEAGAQGPRFTGPLVATAAVGALVLLWLGLVPTSLAAIGHL